MRGAFCKYKPAQLGVESAYLFYSSDLFRRSLDDRHCLINMTVFVLDLVHTLQDSEKEFAETDPECTV